MNYYRLRTKKIFFLSGLPLPFTPLSGPTTKKLPFFAASLGYYKCLPFTGMTSSKKTTNSEYKSFFKVLFFSVHTRLSFNNPSPVFTFSSSNRPLISEIVE